MTSSPSPKPPLMRSLGQFFGHLIKGIRTNPARKKVIRKTIEEKEHGDLILRRTTIDEVEIPRKKRNQP